MQWTPGAVQDRLLEDNQQLADLLMGTFNMLPADCQQMVLLRLAAATAHHDRTGDLAPMQHFCESLVMTARAQRCHAYLMVTSEQETPGEPRDLREVIAEIEARQRDAGT